MNTYIIPYDEPLIKAAKPPKPPKPPNLGTWKGLPIIAIGKRNGKIVGYDKNQKPIYANSKAANSLAAINDQNTKDKVKSVGAWLWALGIYNSLTPSHIFVQPASAALLEDQFGVKGTKVGGAVQFKFSDISKHAGKPFTPKKDELAGWSAGMASGEIEEDPFPDLSTLKQIEAGEFYGSHGNMLFKDPTGQRWVFKAKDPAIARAEEACARIGRLIVGDLLPPARVVTIGKDTGALIKVLPGEPLNESNHSNPPEAMLDKHRKAIAKHFVVDWLTSNHDGHAGNFLASGDKLYAIDKGQAWKFFGQDKLTKDYSPNPSKPIYNKFWNAVQAGTIPLDTILDALGEALDNADTISPEQYRAIIDPYVNTAATQFGFSPEPKAKGMVERLGTLRADMEGFLSKLTGKPVKIPQKHADNFETMPEAEGLDGQKLTITVPDKPKTIQEGPTKVVTAEKVAGWPMTKGKVTINHPGEASPGGKWPKGYPGPGFSSSITYKKQAFAVEFSAGVGGKIQVGVTYPDGSKKSWPSPNQASDSMYLYVQGLPLSMTATEKKAKAISLPAKKAFGVVAFKTELAQAHAGELPVAAMNPKELEQAKVIPENAPELSAEAVISKMSDGVVTDWDELPHEIKEAMLANDFTIGKDYPAAIVPGWAYKTIEDGVPVLYFPSKPDTPGKVLYHRYKFESGGLVKQLTQSSIVDVIYDLASNAELQSVKKDIVQDLPQTADEKIGAAPKAEIPKEAKVPPEAPKAYDGPLPPGTSQTVKKKFPWGKGEVMLLAHTDGFDVSFWDGEGAFQTKTFKSLSAASDWVWVQQKGYADAAAYKAATGKNKVPSGGGWKFWGLSTKPKPEVSKEVPKTPDGKPGLESLEKYPSSDEISAYPVGTTLLWDDQGGANKAVKIQEGAGDWEIDTSSGPIKITHSMLSSSSVASAASNAMVKVPEVAPAAPAPVVENWETMPEVPSETQLKNMATGSVLRFASASNEYTAEKLPDGKWKIEWDEDTVTDTNWYLSMTIEASQESMQDQGKPFSVEQKTLKAADAPPAIPDYGDPLEGLPTTWSDIAGLSFTLDLMEKQPKGAQLKVGGEVWVKTGAGLSKWMNIQTGKSEFAGVFFQNTKKTGKQVQLRVVDAAKLVDQQKAVESVAAPVVVEGKGLSVVEVKPTIAAMKPGDELTWEAKDGAYSLKRVADGTYNLMRDGEPYWVEIAPDEVNDAIPWNKVPNNFQFIEAPTAPTTKDIPMEAEALIEALAGMQPGDSFTWNEGGDEFQYTLNEFGGYKGVNLTEGYIFTQDDNLHTAFDKIEIDKGESAKLYSTGVAKPTTPSEDNWETMPEETTDSSYASKLAGLPLGAQLKMVSKASGKEWTAVKVSDIGYNLINPYGQEIKKSESGMGSFMVNMEGIKFLSSPTPVTPAVAASDPFLSAIMGQETVVDLTPNSADIELVLDDMKAGQELSWEEHGKPYKVVALGDGYFDAYAEETGEKLATNAPLYEVKENIDWSTNPTNFKLKTPGKPKPPKKTKTVTTSIADAVSSELSEAWGSKFFKKASNKPGHTNIFVADDTGSEVLKALAEKHGLTIANKGGEPKNYFDKWCITVPNADLGKTITTEVPVDGPIPESAEASDVPEDKEEAKWAAAGVLGGKAQTLLTSGYQFKWTEDVLPDDNVVSGKGVMSGAQVSKIEAKGLKVIKGKKPKPKPELSPEQKAKNEKAKQVSAWLKDNPPPEAKDLNVLAHFQDLFGFHKEGMQAWARSGGKGKLLLGSPADEFANLMADMEKTQGLKTKKVETPLGTFWEVKTTDLAKAIPGQPADTVKSPDGKVYPKGTTFQKKTVKTTTQQFLEAEPAFYKIKDHNVDPKLKVLKFKVLAVQGTEEEEKQALKDMAKKHGLPDAEPIKGSVNWLMFVPAADLEKVAKTETEYEAKVPPQPAPFAPASYPTMGALKAGEPGISNRSDLATMNTIKIGGTGHSVRMGAPGIFKNGQVYVRKLKDPNGKIHYEVQGELEHFNPETASMLATYDLALPSSMKGTNVPDFEDGIHNEQDANLYNSGGYIDETSSGSKVQVFGDKYEALRNMFTVRVPEGADLESELGLAFESMGLDAGAAMREHTPEDERILKKAMIVKNKIGPAAWAKVQTDPDTPPVFSHNNRYNEAWLDQKLKSLKISKAMVNSARFQTTVANHQSVVIDDPKIANAEQVKFVYMGMDDNSVFNQVVNETGWCSRTHYVMNGEVYGSELSSGEADLGTGGANAAFCRIGTSTLDGEGWGYACGSSKWKVIFHKRILNRTNWRLYNGDAFGSTKSMEYAQPRDGVLQGKKTYKNKTGLSESSEVDFDVGVGTQDVAGLWAPNEHEKSNMIKRLNAKGITEVNGIALDDFIQTSVSYSRSVVASKFVGLKEGVLP